jgi:2-methylcitrate dehydratase
VQIFFCDGSATEKVEVEYPVGHRRRRAEGIPLLVEKFKVTAETCFPAERVKKILVVFENSKSLDGVTADKFAEQFIS